MSSKPLPSPETKRRTEWARVRMFSSPSMVSSAIDRRPAVELRSLTQKMESNQRKGYSWAISAGVNAALAAISAKFFSSQLKYGLVVFFNVIMWGCYVNSLKTLSSLQATVTNFATNFLFSGLAGFFLFEEALPAKWFAGALLIVIGVIVLTKSSVEKKAHAS